MNRASRCVSRFGAAFTWHPATPAEAVKFWSDAIQKMVATPEWAAEREKMGWEPTLRFGDEFNKFVPEEIATFKDLLKELGFLK